MILMYILISSYEYKVVYIIVLEATHKYLFTNVKLKYLVTVNLLLIFSIVT